MRLNTLLAAAAIAAMTAGAAVAQTDAAPGGPDATAPAPMNSGDPNAMAPTDPNAAPPPAAAPMAPSADQSGTPASASMGGPVTSSPTPVASAYTLKAGDPNVISNPPIPDTPANRAQYGRPMSNAGKHTAAAGN
jgi:hypothetical protein